MSRLTIHSKNQTEIIDFQGSPLLGELLFERADSPEHVCGGRGVCKKCTVRLQSDSDSSPRTVLACQERLTGDAQVWLNSASDAWYIEGSEESSRSGCTDAGRLTPCIMEHRGHIGAAIDIGSTTLVLQLLNISTGEVLATAAAPNPQRRIAADVMGRIQAAMEGKGSLLKKLVTDAVSSLLSEACEKAGLSEEQVSSKVITGNTTMLMLLTGKDPSSLSKAPFTMSDSFGRSENCASLGSIYLPRCLHGFVGADTTCAILSCGLLSKAETALLCDIGTNGEIVLWKNGTLYVTSTAAGPAFEGAGITCGCGSINGAIDHVTTENGRLIVHLIGNPVTNSISSTKNVVTNTVPDAPSSNTVPDALAAGLCGSGLIDAVACGLELGLIEETGACEEEKIVLAGNVALYPEDIRTLQLAKAAVQAGIYTLLELSKTSYEEISALYLAGGFGSHLDPASAGRIGLIPPELTEKICAVGNAALKGAGMLLCDASARETEKRIAALAQHVNLGGNPLFNDYYMEGMLFSEE